MPESSKYHLKINKNKLKKKQQQILVNSSKKIYCVNMDFGGWVTNGSKAEQMHIYWI